MRELIESEIQRLIIEGQERARKLLREKENELHKVGLRVCPSIFFRADCRVQLANALVEYETLDLEEVKKVIKGEPIRSVEERLLEVIQDPPPESDDADSTTKPIPEPTPQPIASVS